MSPNALSRRVVVLAALLICAAAGFLLLSSDGEPDGRPADGPVGLARYRATSADAGGAVRPTETRRYRPALDEARVNSDSAEGGLAPSIVGKVVDGRGRPVSGARVAVIPDRLRGFGPSPSDPPVAVVETDSSGGFEFDGVIRSECYALRASHPGFRTVERRPIRMSEPATLRPRIVLVTGQTVRGEVRDERGQPLPGVTVAAMERADARSGAAVIRLERSVTSDADGRYELTNLAPGDKRVLATGDGWAATGKDLTVFDGVRPARVDLTMTEAARVIAGRVIDSISGAPVAGVKVLARISGRGPAPIAGAPADPKRLDPRRSGPRRVAAGTTPAIDANAMVPKPGPGGRMTMSPVWPRAIATRARLELTTVSAEDGAFRFEGAIDAEYVVSVDDPDQRARHEWRVLPGDEDLEVSVTPYGRISGVVVDGAGVPVPSFVIGLGASADRGLLAPEARRHVHSEDGRFSLVVTEQFVAQAVQADAGPLWVHVLAAGFAGGSAGPFQVRAGERIDGVSISMTGGARLSGQVLGHSGVPVSGALVTVVEPMPERPTNRDVLLVSARRSIGTLDGILTRTDGDGRYVIDNVPAGRFQIRARRDGHAEGRSEPFACNGADEIAVPELRLDEAAVISGRVIGCHSARVVVASTVPDGPVRIVLPADDGAFRCADLPEGTYRVLMTESERPDPARLLRARDRATLITVAAGEERAGLRFGGPAAPVAASPKKNQ